MKENLKENLFDIVSTINRVSVTGMETGADLERRRLLPYFEAIFTTYRTALGNPKTVIPTPLHLAIANAQRFIGEMQGQDEHKSVLGCDAMVREPA